ncbi:MAG: hypothetical protein MI863_26395 [Desulfobacterales bacterium]|nr:hypothetical protein [Desulfobacterales bacterium]
MTEMIFDFLTKIGFLHPVHPALTHIPMGMVMGAVIFRFGSFLPRLKVLATTGYHCLILGLLGMPPTIFAGYLDWQHRYDGEWETLIVVKMVLAALLSIVMVALAVIDKPEEARLDKKTGLYALMILLAVGLGYSGGELIFG